MYDLPIFVLDDDDFMLEAARASIESLGQFRVLASTSPKRILDELEMDSARQLLLCDLNMPEMDGVEVIRHLASRSFAGGVVLMSGEDARTLQTVVNVGRASHLNLLGALAKPLDSGALGKLLKQLEMQDATLSHARPSLSEEEIRAGLEGGAVIPHFQPQIDAGSRRVVGVEALARWRHPEYGLLAPGGFIPKIEELGLIALLTEQMIVESMKQWRRWRNDGIDLMLALNVSMWALENLEFPEWLVATAREVGMPLDRLVLEITESHLSHDVKVSSDILARLCLKRIRLSIDDFGTSYSNFERLQMLPFEELKIDRSFVNGAERNNLSRSILQSSADLGRRFGMSIVAEGVESEEDWKCAANAGCHTMQGYFIARPMEGEALGSWVRQWH